MTLINQYEYYCQKCDKKLSDNNQVVFTVERANKEKAKLFLDPKPGTYNYKCEPSIIFDKDELVNFYCPHCNQDLKSEKYPKFVVINLKVTENVFIEVFFSRINGVHKTYVGIEDFEEEYGDQMK